MSSVLRIAVTGLGAAQAALATTGHNIANVGTPGFSRQAVVQSTQSPVFFGGGFYGTGVAVESVVRRYDEVLAREAQRSESAASHFAAEHALAAGVERLLGDPHAGLAPSLSEFFAAVNAVAAQPGDAASRQALLASGETLAARVRMLGQSLQQAQDGIDRRLEAAVAAANTITAQVARLNDRVALARGTGQPPNDLLDERDRLVTELGRLAGVSTAVQDDGALNVYLSSGEPLVVGDRAYALAAVPDRFEPTRRTLALGSAAGPVEVRASDLAGGEIGGALAARRAVIDPAANALGRLALVLADRFNAQHRLGQDRDGNPGGDFFSVGAPWVGPAAGNRGDARLAASLADAGALAAADYEITYTGSEYSVRNRGDGTLRTFATLPATLDGVTLALATGAPLAGDRFLLRPTRDAAGALAPLIGDPARVAAAAPVVSAPGDNRGSAAISQPVVLAADPNLRATVTLTFNADGTFDVSGAGTGDPAGVPYTPGAAIAYNGWTVEIEGVPRAGDRFTVVANVGGAGDNRNAQRLALLQGERLVAGGAFTLADAHAAAVAQAGIATRSADIAAKAQASMLAEAKRAAQSVSGVNLDEEAANLLRYQQAYHAAGKLVQAANTLFDTLLSIVS